MGMQDYKIRPEKLAVPLTGGAAKLEKAYADERMHLELKRKYRPQRATLSQWGYGSDNSGTRKKKGKR